MKATLGEAQRYLRWLRSGAQGRYDLDDWSGVDIFALVGLATLARVEQPAAVGLVRGGGPSSSFAAAVGLDEVVRGRGRRSTREPGRTVSLARFRWAEPTEIDPLAADVARLVAGPPPSQPFDAVKYVIVELLRNVVQHSGDPLGGIVAAQIQEDRRVQVAVGDAGIGVLAHLRRSHPRLADAGEALRNALRPHYSGAFAEGQTGTAENAGLGLHVLSELAKMTGGAFLLASRGDALLLRDRPRPEDRAQLLDDGGFPGTLVVFECVLDQLGDFRSLLAAIVANADLQRPTRITGGIVRFDESPPPDAPRYVVRVAAEDTARAVEFARETLLPVLSAGRPVVLDFRNTRAFSQSYLHALLYVPIRVAWATKAPLHVVNVEPIVRTGIEWIQGYALVG